MNADEVLARQLQAEEQHFFNQQQQQLQQLQQQQQTPRQELQSREARFQAQLQQSISRIREYEDETLKARALSVLPPHVLELVGSRGADTDELARRLLAFFKNDFFTWAEGVDCEFCSSSTVGRGVTAAATPDEIAGRADMVEVYSCNACGHITRFPRYNDPGTLLLTRKGRCGEFANAFTLLCRAVGLEARYVKCWEDHVFTEYYSEHQERWIHMDPCENAYDKPLLYEEGWGKEWSYTVAAHRLGIADVSLRYSKDHKATRDRQQVHADPAVVKRMCHTLTYHMRDSLNSQEARMWEGRDKEEQKQLQLERESPSQPMPGRQTGSEEWRAMRGELGNQNPSSESQAAPLRNATTQVDATPQQRAVNPTPQAPRRALRPEKARDSTATPQPSTPLLNVAGLNLDGSPPQPAATGIPIPPTPADKPPTPVAGGATPPATAPAGNPTSDLSGKASQRSPRDAEAKDSRDAFKKKVQRLFAELMAKGDMTPNDAALLALQKAQTEQ